MQDQSTTPAPRRRARALGWAAVGSIVALLMLGSASASVFAVVGTSLNQTPPISSDDVNFQGNDEDCAGTPAGTVIWHFVLTRTAPASATLNVSFLNAGSFSEPSDKKTGGTLHWYVTTGEDTLLAASTPAVGNRLNLSHICNGGTTTTTSTGTTTTSGSSTTTN